MFTKLSRRLPFGVRTFLGTDLPGIGFAVHYRRQDDGVWFPVSLGSEFRIRALFFFNRIMTVSLENKAFEHTHVQTRIYGARANKNVGRASSSVSLPRGRVARATLHRSRILSQEATMASLPESFAELKQRLRASWMAGDFGEIAKLNVRRGRRLHPTTSI